MNVETKASVEKINSHKSFEQRNNLQIQCTDNAINENMKFVALVVCMLCIQKHIYIEYIDSGFAYFIFLVALVFLLFLAFHMCVRVCVCVNGCKRTHERSTLNETDWLQW